jgi:hypothetical protein
LNNQALVPLGSKLRDKSDKYQGSMVKTSRKVSIAKTTADINAANINIATIASSKTKALFHIHEAVTIAEGCYLIHYHSARIGRWCRYYSFSTNL